MKAKLILPDGTERSLPAFECKEGTAVDISGLKGVTTFDSTLANTSILKDQICFIDGEKGVLEFRGVPIGEITAGGWGDFLQFTRFLADGAKPEISSAEYQTFAKAVSEATWSRPVIADVLNRIPRTLPPMAILGSLLPLLDEKPKEGDDILAKVMADMSVLTAMIGRHIDGKAPISPYRSWGYVENFLHMMGMEATPELVAFMEEFLKLHADHGMNASAFACMVNSGTAADIYAILATGVNTLAGPRHGGANRDVADMLQEALRDGTTAAELIEMAVAGKRRLPGHGHNVYKNLDPRAARLMEMVLALDNNDSPLVKLGMEVFTLARESEYFQSKKLFANVDYFSAFLLLHYGFRVEMFPVLFALARTVGWYLRSLQVTKLIRPRSSAV